MMGDIRNDPSMEDILASIKRIIAEDGATVVPPQPARPLAAAQEPPSAAMTESDSDPEFDQDDEEETVLELTQPLRGPTPGQDQEPLILSADAATSSHHALSALSALLVKAKPGEDPTLEGLMREMLRPMLKEWLDARLPGIVEELVQREIKRITGQNG